MRWISQKVRWGVAVVVFGFCGLVATAADPVYYTRQNDWFDAMLGAMEAIPGHPLEQGFPPYVSPVLRGGEAPRFIRIPVKDATVLHLFVSGDPDNIWGQANWADARLTDQDGTIHYLTNLSPEKPGAAALPWDVLKGRHEKNINLHAGLYEPIRMGGREFPRGIHVQADSEIRVPLEGKYEWFEAWIGIDDWTGGQGHVRFHVLGAADAARQALWDLLERDHGRAAPRLEMRREWQDRIWDAPWNGTIRETLRERYQQAAQRHGITNAPADSLAEARRAYHQARALAEAAEGARIFDFEALRLAIQDMTETQGAAYPDGPERLATLDRFQETIRTGLAGLTSGAVEDYQRVAKSLSELEAFRRKALLDNPLLDFDELMVIRRVPVGDARRRMWDDKGLGEYLGLPRQSSWGLSTIPRVQGWDNEIALVNMNNPEAAPRVLYRPDNEMLVTDVDLHFDGDRLLFSMPDRLRQWQVHEMNVDGTGRRQLTPDSFSGIHYYDSCYLPNGEIAFISTAPLQGVPCNAGVVVGMMYLMNGAGESIRQVCFEQDHNYMPSVLNNGRLLYLRWDYTDTPHVWNRVLMSMNPDGTGQMEYYGSNSYWPNSIFFARAVPDHPTKIVGIVTGHHEGRVGDLVVFDPSRGRQEADGVVQQIPGRNRVVEPLIEDKLTEHNWPKFLHPWPLSEHYFLVACKPDPFALWGIYLVDTFDNRTLIKEMEGNCLLEPIPLRPRKRPPVIPSRIDPASDDALIYMVDVYSGPGLRGVPRGTIKSLRVFTYHFTYQKQAGIDHRVGADGPWEVKRVLGTVPVEADGSAFFRAPARTPLSVQPLDEQGRAVALMRSWLTAQPGETLSCIGCHDRQSGAPPAQQTLAARKAPVEITPWRGPVRNFNFRHEVQPVLDTYCVGCHDGQDKKPDLRARDDAFIAYRNGDPEGRLIENTTRDELIKEYGGVFDVSYDILRRYVRVGGLESDLHVLQPMEFHSDTTELVQMLRKGHHGVRLDDEAWDRLQVWIDLNAPCNGIWSQINPIKDDQQIRRMKIRSAFGGVGLDLERPLPDPPRDIEPILPEPTRPRPTEVILCAGWPFDGETARSRQIASGPTERVLDLGAGVAMEFVRIPAGRFVMGDPAGEVDERPASVVVIDRPFWMSRYEVTNEQYRRFAPAHDSRFEHRSSWIFSEKYLGWPLNDPRQPVVRVSWAEAMDFARWLSGRTNGTVTLPTEAQWEYACRAGSDTALNYGDLDADFSAHGNMGDVNLRKLAYEGWRPLAPDLVVRDDRFDDGALVTRAVGAYRPNPWGLYDMHGNVAEWTRSPYGPALDAVTADGPDDDRVVRGGSWRDRPKRCRSAFRLAYRPWQRVVNVGFRVIIDDPESLQVAQAEESHGRK